MIFHSVSLKNFKSYPDIEQTVTLDHTGIKLVAGANAQGKTTIFESIIWCLYGKTLQDSVDDVINRYTKRNCKVSVIFSINGEAYSVFRYRNHETHGNALYIFQGDKNISLKNVSDTQQLIQDVIQIPYNTLINSIIFSTELYTSFFRAKTSERLKIIESILSLKEVNQLYDINKKKITEYNESITAKESEKNKLISNEELLKETNDAYVENSKKTLLSLKNSKTQNLTTIKELQQKLKELEKIDVDKEYSLFQITEFNDKLDEEIKKEKILDTFSLEKKLEQNKKELFEINSIGDIDESINKIKINNEIEKEIEKIKSEISSLKTNIISLEYYEKEIQRLTKEEKKIIKEKEVILTNRCHTCGQLIDAEKNKELLESKENELAEVSFLLDKLKQNLEEADEINKELNLKIEGLTEKNNELGRKIIFVPWLEEDLISRKDRKNTINTDILLHEKELQNIEATNKATKERIENLKKQKKDITITYTKDFLDALKDNIEETKEIIKKLENENASIDMTAKTVFDKSFVESNDSKIKILKKAIKKEDEEIKALKEDLKYYQILSAVFSNKEGGFKKYFIDKMISVFNETINFYLPFFFDKTISIVLDKDLNETIVFDENKINFSSLSSGQKTRVEIATSFALFNLVKVFFSNETNLIVMDEILDKNLDSEGFEAVIEVVNGLAKSNSIFIVSHREELKERFNNKISIRLEEGKFSKIIQ